MEKIAVCLTSISGRGESLHLTLESLLAQEYQNLEVRVYVSPDPFLLDEGYKAIPQQCQDLLNRDPRLKWCWVNNFGSYRKLLPALYDPALSDTIIVTADDDTIYPTNWLSTLYYYYKKHNCIIAYRGHAIAIAKGEIIRYRRWMGRDIRENPSRLLLPTGKDGVLYHPAFFHPGVHNVYAALETCLTADDLWFKWHTAVTGVPVYVVHSDYSSSSLQDTNTGPSLYRTYNEGGANDLAIAALERYSHATFGDTLVGMLTR